MRFWHWSRLEQTLFAVWNFGPSQLFWTELQTWRFTWFYTSLFHQVLRLKQCWNNVFQVHPLATLPCPCKSWPLQLTEFRSWSLATPASSLETNWDASCLLWDPAFFFSICETCLRWCPPQIDMNLPVPQNTTNTYIIFINVPHFSISIHDFPCFLNLEPHPICRSPHQLFSSFAFKSTSEYVCVLSAASQTFWSLSCTPRSNAIPYRQQATTSLSKPACRI